MGIYQNELDAMDDWDRAEEEAMEENESRLLAAGFFKHPGESNVWYLEKDFESWAGDINEAIDFLNKKEAKE